MSSFFSRISTVLLGLAAFATAADPRVALQNGSIKGKVLTVSNATADAYLGIPFAKSPVRFLAPESADQISGEYDATKWKSSCMQTGSGSKCHIQPVAPKDDMLISVYSFEAILRKHEYFR